MRAGLARNSAEGVMNAIELETRYRAHNYTPLPVVLTREQGAHLWDRAASHGHGRPRIPATVSR